MSKRTFAAANPDREKSKKRIKKKDLTPEDISEKAKTSLSVFFGNEKKEEIETPQKIDDAPLPRGFSELAGMPQDFPGKKADIWCWNINGINAQINKGTLEAFLKEHDPQILCLNETKIDEEKLDLKKFPEQIPGPYAQYWNCCTEKKGYSGTAIFTKVAPLKVEYNFGKHLTQGRSITMEFNAFTLVATYVPNAG